MRIMAERMTQPFYHLNFIWKLTKSYKILTNYQKYGRNLFTKVKFIKMQNHFLYSHHFEIVCF